jgi:hypothetical protein
MGLKATRMPPQKHILTYKNIKMKKKTYWDDDILDYIDHLVTRFIDSIDFNNFFLKNNLYLIIW